MHLYVDFCCLALDESFAVLHNRRGILGMANKGPHSNGSQFYITLQPTPWMDRTYVAFGLVSQSLQLFKLSILYITCFLIFMFLYSYSRQMVEGINVLRRVEEIATFNERPVFECKVAECGLLECKGPEIRTYTACDI